MNNLIDEKILVVSKSISIDEMFRQLSFVSKNKFFPGVALVLNEEKLIGVVTDGDVRRAYSNNIEFNSPISEIMSYEPFFIYENEINELPKEKAEKFFIKKPKFIPILDSNNRVKNVLEYNSILNNLSEDDFKVVVYGLGFVGLTLSIAIADNDIEVFGIDNNSKLISNLNKYNSHVKEPGLNQILKSRLNNNLSFKDSFINIKTYKKTVFIISVGTPLLNNNIPDLSAICSVLSSICAVLSKGDVVMLRSTVPLGTTRKIVIPYLESNSNLKAGVDFFVAFTPERTIEGDALNELRALPQIIGGYSINCRKEARNFWSKISKTIVNVESLEAAEMVKLINNTFRDISFSFANEVALKCDQFNINSFDLIKAANEGYPRNKISLPSPGVGGYCLTKDPYLFSHDSHLPFKSLGEKSREINKYASDYPLKIFQEYVVKNNLISERLKILISGLTFKGVPENNDTRGSVAIELLEKFKVEEYNIDLFDFSLKKQKTKNLKLISKLKNNIYNYDAIFIMNNHPENSKIDFSFINHEKPLFIFDGWNLLNKNQIALYKNITYSTMGYVSNR
jgi:UDP-N-acetyl-D-mannosaminuronic acid dehydrogenase